MSSLSESIIEEAALEWFEELGYAVGHGPHLAPGELAAERDSFGEVVLVGRLRKAISRLNPSVPGEARDDALRKVLRVGTPSLTGTNRDFHRMLRDGVEVEYQRADGSIAGDHVRLVDFTEVGANDWLAVNQFTVIEGHHNRRPDIVVFVNGLALGLVELKKPEEGEEWFDAALKQLETYKAQIPSLLHYNAALVVSDGLQARMGSLTANREWFKVWRTVDGEADAPKSALELEVLVRGVFERRRFLDLLHHFIVFEEDPDSGALHKIIAGYHQFHAVNAAVEETVRASGMEAEDEGGGLKSPEGRYWAGAMKGGKPGDRRAGVVWHTQGSGKSYSMLFYAARVIRHPAMKNPTLVVLTDRNDLDDQLFGQFQRCADILGHTPLQADSRDNLRTLLNRASGGVVFTTIHKFMPEKGEDMPELSGRRNIVVIADEAHRSQYGFGGKVNEKTGAMSYGFASNMRDALPNASYIGFTGTPIEKTDANTRAVFGDYISVYDIQRAVADKATVPIYYESRISKLSLNAAALPGIDEEFDEITEGEELTKKEKLKSKWAALEALVGDPKRIAVVAEDLRESLQRACGGAPGMGGRQDERGDDRQRGGRPGVAAAHPQQGQAQGAGEPFQGCERPFPHRDRAGHVADGIRRAVPAHDVCGQADARPRPDAGDRAGEPGFQKQAGRADRGLPRAGGSAQEGAGDLHGKRRAGQPDLRHGGGHRGDVGEIRHRLRHDARLRPQQVGGWKAIGTAGADPRRAGAHPRTGGREAEVRAGGDGAFQGLRAIGGKR